MKKRQFVLVVLDRDTGEFTVEGPMSDDRLWNSAVVNAQRVGRNIRCFSMGNIAPDVAATEWHLSYGGRRIGSGSIVWASHHVVQGTVRVETMRRTTRDRHLSKTMGSCSSPTPGGSS